MMMGSQNDISDNQNQQTHITEEEGNTHPEDNSQSNNPEQQGSSKPDEGNQSGNANGVSVDKSNSEEGAGTSSQPAENQENPEHHEEHELHSEHHDDHEHDHEDHHEEEVDYSHTPREDLLNILEQSFKEDSVFKVDKKLNDIKPYFDEIEHQKREEAYQKFVNEGGEQDGFEYKLDETAQRFYELAREIKKAKKQEAEKNEAKKQENLKIKQDILEELRSLVDGEESDISLKSLKRLQDKWKNTGPAPGNYNKTLWANYKALIDRFYNNRSIFFELKELDRKKNLDSKKELCEKAEALTQYENMREAVKELDDLHNEFRHIGPVPQEEQESIWQRFKQASDYIHQKRKEQIEQLKSELKENEEKKKQLIEEAKSFAEFWSESIKEWNKKTDEIKDLQKRWESIGGLPRESAKSINKAFWSNFKEFFARKSKFFKALDEAREKNLKEKEKLIEQAKEVTQSEEDKDKIAEKLKELQRQWKNIGPVPYKVKDKIFDQFKSICDDFFEKRRAEMQTEDQDYTQNLKAREEICSKIEEQAKQGPGELNTLLQLAEEYFNTGLVPKKHVRQIQSRFGEAVSNYMNNVEGVEEEDIMDTKMKIQVMKLKNSPNPGKKLEDTKASLKKEMSKIREDVDRLKINIQFFASSSSQGQKIKNEYEEKIEEAYRKLDKLNEQYRAIEELEEDEE